MKRSPELTPLSHDHHQALFVAMRLKRAEDALVASQMIEFFDAHGRRHFEIEEGVLLPAWFELDPEAVRDEAARMLDEHLSIRAGVRKLRAGRHTVEVVRELGELLEAHVRFEERELFPMIEDALSAEDLARLGAEISAAEAEPG